MRRTRILEQSGDAGDVIKDSAEAVEQAALLLEDSPQQTKIKQLIATGGGTEVLSYLNPMLHATTGPTAVIKTAEPFNVEALPDDPTHGIINFQKMNDVRDLNEFLRVINRKLPVDGLFVGCVETKNQRKHRLLKKYPPVLNGMYYFMDFIFKRVFPKLPVVRGLYFFVTAGRNHPLSKAETLGRLFFNGFEVEEAKEINNLLYFTARKEEDPIDRQAPSGGPLLATTRIGRKGKPIKVFKFRTMHPYAEHLQDYIYRTNALRDGGKIRNDYRITGWGRIMRKLWIDELPMIWNLLKGDLKLVGVRPISRHYLSLYDEDLVAKRRGVRPGLVPPFYADLPTSLDEIMDSERRYIEAYHKAPFRTDVRYFFKAFGNIVFRNARSN